MDGDDPLDAAAETAMASGEAFLTPLGPYILAAAKFCIASDSRSFARKFDVAHALVIRECVHLQEDLGLLVLEDRGDKSQRLFYELSQKGYGVLPGEPWPQ